MWRARDPDRPGLPRAVGLLCLLRCAGLARYILLVARGRQTDRQAVVRMQRILDRKSDNNNLINPPDGVETDWNALHSP